MSETCKVKLEPEESSVCRPTVSEHLIAQSSPIENYLSGGCESEVRIKYEVEEFTDANSTACAETSTSLRCVESLDHLIDTDILAKSFRHEQEASSTFVFATCSQTCNTESFNDSMNMETGNAGDCFSEEIPDVKERSAESNCVMADVKEDESGSETSDADSSGTQPTDAERITVPDMIGTNQSRQNIVQRNGCPVCKMNFSDFQGLKRHMQRKHVTDRQHCCIQCEKSYSVKADLSQHIRRAHRGNKYQCDKCNYSSAYSHDLKSHNSAVHLEEKAHRCPQCDSHFSLKSLLMQHLITIHNYEKPFECSACDKKFSRREHRDIHHSSVHCGEKPYSCNQCDYKCSQKSNLSRHRRIVHD